LKKRARERGVNKVDGRDNRGLKRKKQKPGSGGGVKLKWE